jgi:hypothetical protein
MLPGGNLKSGVSTMVMNLTNMSERSKEHLCVRNLDSKMPCVLMETI